MQTLLDDVKDNTAPTSIKVAETSFGKNISIARGKNGQMFVIDVAGGGTKPVELEGHFTGWTAAEEAVKRYVDSGNGRLAPAKGVTLSEKNPDDVKPTMTKRPQMKMQTPDFMAPASE